MAYQVPSICGTGSRLTIASSSPNDKRSFIEVRTLDRCAGSEVSGGVAPAKLAT